MPGHPRWWRQQSKLLHVLRMQLPLLHVRSRRHRLLLLLQLVVGGAARTATLC